MQIPPATSLAFTMSAQPGAYALLVGAGASMSAGMKSAWHVQRELILRIAATEGEEETAVGDGEAEGAPFQWFEDKYGEEATYGRLLDALAPSRLQRLNVLKDFFTADEDDREAGRKQPMPAHDAIAALVASRHVRLIVTLNFDHLIEQAVSAAGIEPVVVNTEAGIEGLQPLHEYECLIVHLHGDYTHPEMRNTPDELRSYPDAVLTFLRRLQADYGLLATGWSGQWDPALRDVIDAAGNTRYPMYWVNPSAPKGDGAALAARKNAIVCESSADLFFPDLRARVDAIEARAERHPLDAAALATTAKRELDDLNSRAIATHDNLLGQMREAQQDADFRALMDGAHSAGGALDDQRDRALSQVEPLAALLAVLAYWGNPETDGWWVQALPAFAMPPRYGQWTRPDPKLQVGAVLYTVAAVAAVAAERDDLVATLMSAETRRLPNTPRTLEVFGPNTFDLQGSGSSMLHERVTTVLADHLLLSESSIQEAWETWEYLALVHGFHLEDARQEHTSDRWTPHIRRNFSDGLPVIGEHVRKRVSRPDSPLLHRLFDGDENRFVWTADRWDEVLASVDKYVKTGGGHLKAKVYYDDH